MLIFICMIANTATDNFLSLFIYLFNKLYLCVLISFRLFLGGLWELRTGVSPHILSQFSQALDVKYNPSARGIFSQRSLLKVLSRFQALETSRNPRAVCTSPITEQCPKAKCVQLRKECPLFLSSLLTSVGLQIVFPQTQVMP